MIFFAEALRFYKNKYQLQADLGLNTFLHKGIFSWLGYSFHNILKPLQNFVSPSWIDDKKYISWSKEDLYLMNNIPFSIRVQRKALKVSILNPLAWYARIFLPTIKIFVIRELWNVVQTRGSE